MRLAFPVFSHILFSNLNYSAFGKAWRQRSLNEKGHNQYSFSKANQMYTHGQASDVFFNPAVLSPEEAEQAAYFPGFSSVGSVQCSTEIHKHPTLIFIARVFINSCWSGDSRPWNHYSHSGCIIPRRPGAVTSSA